MNAKRMLPPVAAWNSVAQLQARKDDGVIVVDIIGPC